MIILKKRVVHQMNPKIDAQFIDPNFRFRSWHCESVGSLDVQNKLGLSNGSRLSEKLESCGRMLDYRQDTHDPGCESPGFAQLALEEHIP